MYKHQGKRLVFTPLYIHTFSFVIPKNSINLRKFEEKHPNLELINHTGTKIRYFRYKRGLHQKDIADYIGFTSSAMVYYEKEERDFYEIDVLEKIAELLEVDLLDLLDDYNLFLYQEQSAKLKEFRKKNGLTQRQLAEHLGVDISKIKSWEQSKVRMSKSSFNKFVSFAEFIKN